MKIGDLTDRILDEVVHDLTPYGYEELDTSKLETYATGVYELDNKKRYISIKHVHQVDNVECKTSSNELSIVYSHDVMADIILNSNTEESSKLTTEVDNKLTKDIIRELASYEVATERRVCLLRRKTITRAYRKIVQIITENKVDMSIKEDEIKGFIGLLK